MLRNLAGIFLAHRGFHPEPTIFQGPYVILESQQLNNHADPKALAFSNPAESKEPPPCQPHQQLGLRQPGPEQMCENTQRHGRSLAQFFFCVWFWNWFSMIFRITEFTEYTLYVVGFLVCLVVSLRFWHEQCAGAKHAQTCPPHKNGGTHSSEAPFTMNTSSTASANYIYVPPRENLDADARRRGVGYVGCRHMAWGMGVFEALSLIVSIFCWTKCVCMCLSYYHMSTIVEGKWFPWYSIFCWPGGRQKSRCHRWVPGPCPWEVLAYQWLWVPLGRLLGGWEGQPIVVVFWKAKGWLLTKEKKRLWPLF